MDHFLSMNNLEPFYISMNKAQRVNACAGNRYYYHHKDLQMRPGTTTIPGRKCYVMTDVDYYLDMNRLLRGDPVIIYTFVPLEPMGKTADGVYTTTTGDLVKTNINGGAEYKHPLWNYECDSVMVHHALFSVMYLVEQLQVSRDRRIVFFNPIRTIYGPVGRLINSQRLERRPLSFGPFAFTRFFEKGECYYSLGKLSEYHTCTVKSQLFSTALIRSNETRDPHIGQIERIFNYGKVDNGVEAASLYFDAYKRCPELFDKLPPLITGCVDQHTYQAVTPLVTEDGKSSMRALWPGYVNNTYSPAKSYNNDKACIAGRIDEPRNKEKKLPPIYYKFMTEFLEFLVPHDVQSTLTPLNFDEMYDKFDRPTQRRQLAAVEHYLQMKNPVVSSFQKPEAYPKITPPRNISTLPMDHNFVLGQFTNSFMSVLKATHWYAFGKTPKVISYTLHSKTMSHRGHDTSWAVPSDFEKLDGSLSSVLRDLYTGALCRAFHPRYHPEISRLMSKERNVRAFTKEGVAYDTGSTVLSGSSDTSQLGSISNAFVTYCALRYHHDAINAWNSLGIYGGDDGVTFDLSPNSLMLAGAKFGMSIKAEVVKRGDPVPFLGRIYVDPWTGPESIVDVMRQYRKMHLTATPKVVPASVVLFRKGLGLWITDAQTPLISHMCMAITRVYGDLSRHKYFELSKVDRSYWLRYASPDQFPAPKDRSTMMDIIANNMGIDDIALTDLIAKFMAVQTEEELLSIPMLHVPDVVQIDAQVGTTIKRVNKYNNIPANVRKNAKLKVQLCRFVQKGQECKYGDRCVYSHLKTPVVAKHKRSAN